ncbi:Gfo/Idh/MocA family protein [Streptomyces sp. NPDC018031]|uniref:Gfo/Idh/MocA family protein n=1 Tax=Streptomyces sp. NPDC018031 TaxID=3365033 RepID=UPI0037B0E7A0
MDPSAPPLRCGVLGCADFARRRMLPVLAAEPGIRLAAVASRDAAKAASFGEAFGCPPVHGYEALLADPDIDAVYLPLPPMLHAEWIEKALRAGKHVLAEKPLTADPASTERLLRLAASRGLVLLENVAFPHHAQHAAVTALLAGRSIGELRDFTATFTIPPRPEDDIRYQPRVGGGALLDLGIYPIRAALHFLGPDVEVRAAVLRHQARTGAVVAGRILAVTPGGVTADLGFGMEHSYRSGCEFAGSTGRLLLDRVFTPPADHRPVARLERQDHREEITLPADDQYANLVRHFLHAVRTGAVGTSAEQSMRQARLVGRVTDLALRVTG